MQQKMNEIIEPKISENTEFNITIENKKCRRSIEDTLCNGFRRVLLKKHICKLVARKGKGRIPLLAHTILAPAISIVKFENVGLDYILSNHNNITTDIGFILPVIPASISECMKYNIRKKIENYIPPLEDKLSKESSTYEKSMK